MSLRKSRGPLNSIRLAVLRWINFPLPWPGLPSVAELLAGVLILAFSTVAALSADDGRQAGGLASILIAMLVVVSMRNNFILTAFGISFDHLLPLHKFLGITVIVVALIHGIRVGFKTSGVALAVLVGMSALSYVLISRIDFNYFFYVHIVIYVLILVFAYLHGAMLVVLSVIPWGIDLLLRLIYFQWSIDTVVNRIGAEHLEIVLNKSFSYDVGQFCFLVVPSVNLEFHPFTIASLPSDSTTRFIIKRNGNWTKNVFKVIETSKRSSLKVHIDGPYGSHRVDFDNAGVYKSVLIIAAGVGITAALPLFQRLMHSRKASGCITQRHVRLLWVARDPDLISHVYANYIKTRPFLADDCRGDAATNNNYDSTADLLTVTSSSAHSTVSIFYTGKGKPDNIPESILQCQRPNWLQTFRGAEEDVRQVGGKRVAVFVCGPMVVVDEVKTLCAQSCGKEVHFDCHNEEFGF